MWTFRWILLVGGLAVLPAQLSAPAYAQFITSVAFDPSTPTPGDPTEVIVYCPKKEMQLKEAGVPVRRAGKGIRPLSSYQKEFPALGQLVDSYRDLWKLHVFVPAADRDELGRAGKVVERVLRRNFGSIKNQYRP